MDSAEAVGQGIGRVLIPVVLMLWGMNRCQKLAETPGVNAHGTRGLMYALGAWVLLLLNSGFTPMLAWPITMAGVVVLGIIATVRSIQGLARWNDFKHGNAHGVAGVLIGSGLPALIVFGFLRGFMRS